MRNRRPLPACVRRALAPPENLTPSEWAAKYRTLSRSQSSRHGRWRNDLEPWQVGMMDLFANPNVSEIVIVKGAQLGVSELIRNVIGWIADQCPDPTMLVLPDELSARKIMKKRIFPLFTGSPRLREIANPSHGALMEVGDGIALPNGFWLRPAWSGSASTLASDPMRFVFCDEVDKFHEWAGREADPVSLAYERTATYIGRRKIALASTPTTESGLITRRHSACDHRYRYAVRCVHCAHEQFLSFDRVRWSKGAKAVDLRRDPEASWYECAGCDRRIGPRDRAAMLARGQWRDDAGREIGEASGRVGIHVSRLESSMTPFSELTAEFVASIGDPSRMQNFRNSWLGLPFYQQVATVKGSTVSEIVAASTAARGSVPAWSTRLLMTVDVQQDRAYYVVRAWGPRFRSRRVTHGMVSRLDDLADVLADEYLRDDGSGSAVRIHTMGIDANYRKDDVRVFVGQHQPTAVMMSGRGGRMSREWLTMKDVYTRYAWDTQHYADVLAGRVAAVRDDGEGEYRVWDCDSHRDPDYDRQMAAEHKVRARKRGREVELWQPITPGAQNHYLDCERMQCALADIRRVEVASRGQTLSFAQRLVDRRSR